MKTKSPLRRIRLIPSVLVLGTVLLSIKGAGLALEAHAQETQNATTASGATRAQSDPAADNADDSSAQVDVLTSLAKRRAELDARERDLDMRENLIAAAEKRVDGKIETLKQLQVEIQGLLAQRDDAEQKQLAALVKTYSNMPPKDAARIFNSLDEDVLLSVAQQIKPADLAAIMAKMESEPAQKLTVRLAKRMKVELPVPPPPTPVPPPGQTASTNPSPATPAPTTTSDSQPKAPTQQAATDTAAQSPAASPSQAAKPDATQATAK